MTKADPMTASGSRIAEIARRHGDPAYYPACPGPKADTAYLLSLLTPERLARALRDEDMPNGYHETYQGAAEAILAALEEQP